MPPDGSRGPPPRFGFCYTVTMLSHYRGRVAVITGAARGLGRSIAAELAARGCNLALIDVDSAALDDTAQEVARAGISVTRHTADVASEESVGQAAAEAARAHGAVHLLVSNAAVSASVPFAKMAAADFDRILRVNFFGTVYCCRAFLPFLRQHGVGQILNVSSCFAWLGYPGKSAYVSSKAAIRGFSESLRLELADRGVGVTVLYPGPMYTSLVRGGPHESEEKRDREERFLRARGLSPETVARKSLDRLLANPARIVIGFDYRVLDLLSRLGPAIAGRVVQFGSVRAGF